MDATTAAQTQEDAQGGVCQLQRFVAENALQLVQYISSTVSVANQKSGNHYDSLLTTPKFTEVWIKDSRHCLSASET